MALPPIIYRRIKGSPLTADEVDGNFENLDSRATESASQIGGVTDRVSSLETSTDDLTTRTDNLTSGLAMLDNEVTQDVSALEGQVSALESGKVDKVAGKGLSQNDLTDALYEKLQTIEGSRWQGVFVSLAALSAAIPVGEPGFYAWVDAGEGKPVQMAIWDIDDATWTVPESGGSGGAMTPAQVLEALLANPDVNVLTDNEMALLESLAGVQPGATVNQTDAHLLARANHTGTQLAATISDLANAVRSTVLTGLGAGTSAVIAATDTLLQALAKLQAQIAAKLPNPMTAPGDLIVGGTGGAAGRLPIGTAGQALRVNAAGDGLEYVSSAASVFVSPSSAWVAGGELTFSHGLGRVPNFLQIEAVCTVAVGATPVGTRFKVDGIIVNAGVYRQAQVTFFDATTVRIRVATTLYRLLSAGGADEFTPSNSQIVLRCM